MEVPDEVDSNEFDMKEFTDVEINTRINAKGLGEGVFVESSPPQTLPSSVIRNVSRADSDSLDKSVVMSEANVLGTVVM